MILAGDIGGTHARLALYDFGSRLEMVKHAVFQSRDFYDLDEVVRHFLGDRRPSIESACLGVAGAANLPWTVRREGLADVLKTHSVWLLNDLEAAAHGIGVLEAEDLFELNPGRQTRGNRALIFAGTGLGEAISFRVNDRYFSVASEGGHTDFAARGALEVELEEFLAHKFGHVSWERVLSGQGICNIYEFFENKDPAGDLLSSANGKKDSDASVAIIQAALEGHNRNSRKTMELFALLLGRQAGNLALTALATGGMYLGGGIVPRILPILRGSGFLGEFSNKGRMSSLLSPIPVHVILRDDVGLLGAARFASLSESEKRLRAAA